MDIEKCRTFITCSECKTYGEAAAKLNSTIATVSRHIAELEKQFNVTLFERDVNGLVLTEAGKKCLEAMSGIVFRYDQLKKVVDLPPDGPVMVEYNPPFSMHRLNGGMDAFRSAHPDIAVSINDEDIVIPGLFCHKYEIGIISQRFSGTGDFEGVRFPIGRMGLMVPADHEYSTYDSIPVEQINGLHVLSTERAKDKYWNDQLTQKHGIRLSYTYTIAREDVLAESVRQSGMPALISSGVFDTFRFPDMVFVPFEEDVRVYTSLMKLRAVPLSQRAAVFYEFITKWISEHFPDSEPF